MALSQAEIQRRFMERHPGRRRAQQRKSDRKRRKADPIGWKIKIRHRKVRFYYKLSPQQHEEILAKQEYRCALPSCGKPVDIFSPIDHRHSCCPGKRSCGKCIRGILCHSHNLGIGHFETASLDCLPEAHKYLKR